MDSMVQPTIAEFPRFSPRRILAVLLLLAISVFFSLVSSGLTPYEEVPAERFSLTDTEPITVVDFLDVGQGASTLIRFSDGKVMLVDTGPRSSRDLLLGYLEAREIDKIDCLVLTHQHGDHTDNVVPVLEKYEVSDLLIPDAPASLFLSIPKYESLYSEISDNGYTLRHPQEDEVLLTGNDYTVTVLSNDEGPYPQLNDYSIVIKIEVGDISFLLMADAEWGIEQQLLPAKDLHCDVLQVGHHGNYAGTSESFLKEALPNVAVISVGQNIFGQPADSVMDRLERIGSNVLRTDLCRTVTVTTNGERIYLDYGEI